MKVLCIKNGAWYYRKSKNPVLHKCPKFGDIVTVSGTSVIDGWYILAEYPNTGEPEYGWNPKNFIELSDIDEKELLEQRQTQLQEQ